MIASQYQKNLERLKLLLETWDHVTARECSYIFGIVEKFGSTYPQTHKIIKEIVARGDIPIGSDTEGFFLIRDENEMNRVLNSWSKRCERITISMSRLYNTCVKHGIVRIKKDL